MLPYALHSVHPEHQAPQEQTPWVNPTPRARTQSALNQAAPVLLVLDDNLDFLFLTKIILEREGYQVLSGCNLQDALATLQEVPALTLILLDLKMGPISGLELFAELERLRPELIEKTPFVFYSAEDQIPQGTRALGLIRKDLAPTKLILKVRDFVTQAQPA